MRTDLIFQFQQRFKEFIPLFKIQAVDPIPPLQQGKVILVDTKIDLLGSSEFLDTQILDLIDEILVCLAEAFEAQDLIREFNFLGIGKRDKGVIELVGTNQSHHQPQGIARSVVGIKRKQKDESYKVAGIDDPQFIEFLFVFVLFHNFSIKRRGKKPLSFWM